MQISYENESPETTWHSYEQGFLHRVGTYTRTTKEVYGPGQPDRLWPGITYIAFIGFKQEYYYPAAGAESFFTVELYKKYFADEYQQFLKDEL